MEAYIFAFLVAMIPISHHRYTGASDADTEARYKAIASDIVFVAVNADPLFVDDESHVKTALLLASLAAYEGQLRADVDSCKVSGDGVSAWGLWQTHTAKERVCISRQEAARIALETVRTSFEACHALPPSQRLAAYASGSCERGTRASEARMGRAMKWLAGHPYTATVFAD